MIHSNEIIFHSRYGSRSNLPQVNPTPTLIFNCSRHLIFANQVFQGQMGFSDQELVALIAGGHAYGRCHRDRSGFNGPWTNRPTNFSNIYCIRLLKDKWANVDGVENLAASKCPVAPILGNKQYLVLVVYYFFFVVKVFALADFLHRGLFDVQLPINKQRQFLQFVIPNRFVNKNGDGDLMMLYTDMAMVWDPTWKAHIETYSKDVKKLRTDFGVVFKKLTEFNCPAPGANKL